VNHYRLRMMHGLISGSATSIRRRAGTRRFS